MTLLPKTLERAPLLQSQRRIFPPAPFADAIPSSEGGAWGGRPMPQAIAHRGYKAEWPENTMGAFAGAVAVGAHAIETDLHLSRDGVVVLSHDGTLKRCFGVDKKLADCDWSYLSTLRTTKSPPSPMPRLADLLEYLARPGMESIWLLLDIKRDDDPDELIRRTAETFASVPSPWPWKDRVMMGCWDANDMRRCSQYLPGFPVAFIGFSLPYAWELLKHENVSFNLLQKVLVGPCGTRFLQAAEARGRKVFVWTVNDVEWMEWSITKGGIDGVITDDPKLYLEVCRRHEDDNDGDGDGDDDGGNYEKTAAVMGRSQQLLTRRRKRGALRWIRTFAEVIAIQLLAYTLVLILRITHGSERRRVRNGMRG